MKGFGALLAILFCAFAASPAYTFPGLGYADLACDYANNAAIARFNVNVPLYLPVYYQSKRFEEPGTGHRNCDLSNGWKIRLRNGVEQGRLFGVEDDAPAYFFSLWVNERKVVSRREWVSRGHNEGQRRIASVVVTAEGLNVCEARSARNGQETRWFAAGCHNEPLDLDALPIDEVEYPPDGSLPLTPDPAEINSGGDNSVCLDLLHISERFPNNIGYALQLTQMEPDLDSSSTWLWQDPADNPAQIWSFNIARTFSPRIRTSATIHAASAPVDVDGDGDDDTVVGLEGFDSALSGTYWVVAPGSLSGGEVLAHLFPVPDIEVPDIHIRAFEIARAAGWHVYTGGHPSLYPNAAKRVHMRPLQIDATTYFLVHPFSLEAGPAATLIRLLPGGAFETVCAYDIGRMNY